MSKLRSSRLHQLVRALGPAIAPVPLREALRAGLGALIGLGLLGFVIHVLPLHPALTLIAPFGASSVLIFAVPNSPLAQPWSVIVGNTVSALIGVAVCLSVADPFLSVALAVGLAIFAMILLRAVHPPAGAVAMTAAMNSDLVRELSFGFALAPVALGSAALVAIGVIYARATGRHYPLRQFEGDGADAATDPPPLERLGLSEAELTDILQRYRQSLNLGIEDLARLIGAAELQAATHRTGPMTAADIMSSHLVTVDPDTPVAEIADLFRRHGFTTLPVVQDGDKFLGMIFQLHLIRRAREDALRLERGFGAAMARLLDRDRTTPVRAADIMSVAVPRVTPATPVGALLPLLAEGNCDAVPVLSRGRIVGLVTQTDLIAALARSSLRA